MITYARVRNADWSEFVTAYNKSEHFNAHVTEDSLAFAKQMLDETGVAATPGVDFDEARGRRFLRFSYAGSTAAMAEAADRLKRWGRLSR